jgi:PAS domain-containing protein
LIDTFFNKLPGRSNRLGYRFTVLTIAFSTVIMIFISVLQLTLEYRAMRSDLDLELDSVDVYVRNIAGDLWNLDEVQIQHALEGLQRLPNIQGVEIRSTENNQQWQVGELVKGNILVREFELPVMDRQERLVIGHLKVVASLDGPRREILKRAVIIVVSNSAKSFFVALFMLFLFRRFVTVRLDAIGKKVRRLGPMLFHVDADAEQPQQPMPKKLDELGAFDWTLDQTTLELTRLKAAREADQALIVESEQRFRTLVEQAPEAILMYDLDTGAFIDANPRAEALLECSRGELLQGGVERFFAPLLADG